MNLKESQFSSVRMLNEAEAAAYIGLGKNNARKVLTSIGARKSIGRRVIYDKKVIDKYLDDLSAEPVSMAAAQ